MYKNLKLPYFMLNDFVKKLCNLFVNWSGNYVFSNFHETLQKKGNDTNNWLTWAHFPYIRGFFETPNWGFKFEVILCWKLKIFWSLKILRTSSHFSFGKMCQKVGHIFLMMRFKLICTTCIFLSYDEKYMNEFFCR